MHKLSKLALGGVALFATLTPAIAQPVNVVPQFGVSSGLLPRQTFSAGFVGLVPAAAATDIVCLAGSASKVVKLIQVKLAGTAGTLITVPVTLIRHVTVDTGGTAALTTANPANNVSVRDTLNGAVTAVPVSYTANPTITDATPTYVDSIDLTLPTTAAGTVTIPAILEYGRDQVSLIQPPTLRGAAAQICINIGASTVASGLINGSITWTEE